MTVPFPPDWRLLWELEKYLDPMVLDVEDKAIHYSLDAPALRLAVQRGALDSAPTFPTILEDGLGEPVSADFFRLLAKEPSIRLVPGLVLEFSNPEDLKRLRQSPSLRRALDHLLSPHHVLLDPYNADQVLQRLYRQGLIAERDFSMVQLSKKPGFRSLRLDATQGNLTKSEQAYLFSLMLFAERLQKAIVPPPGLFIRLLEGLNHSLCAAAARKASSALNQISPQSLWQPDESKPSMPPEELIVNLQKAIDLGESIDILYQASGRHTPEYRHLTPLLVESRGSRSYLIAYCHTRRANRTFRLDRLKLCSD